MKMGITSKLLIIMLTANCVVAVAMYWLSSKSFDDGFLEYITQVELEKLTPFTEELSLIYQQNEESWQWIHDDHDKWRQVIDYHIRKIPIERINQRPPPRPRPNDFYSSGRRPPNVTQSRGFERRPPPRPIRRDRSPYTPLVKRIDNRVPSFDRHILLRDEFEQLIIGRIPPKQEVLWLPIYLKSKKFTQESIGDVGLVFRKKESSNLETYFVEQQKSVFANIVIVMLLIAFIVAFLLSRKLMSHINLLQMGLSVLVKGNYEQLLTVTSDDELGQLATDFNFLSKTLKENQISRQQWIADISHELRTPVAILKGELEALIDGVRQVDAAALSSLQQETDRLTRLINDLHELSVSDLGALNYQKESVDLVELVSEFFEDQMPRSEMQNLNVSVTHEDEDAQYKINIDADRIEQCFKNLLQNTLRYTDFPGRLNVHLTRIKKSIVLTWEDSSPGIDDEDFKYLFERLYRVEKSRNRASGGSGIGLSICKNIIEAHDASITLFQSDLGGLGLKIIFSEVQ